MTYDPTDRSRLRITLLVIILATLPCYCAGFVAVWNAQRAGTHPTATSFYLATSTISPSQTNAPVPTATSFPTFTPTGTLSPSQTQTLTPSLTATTTDTLTPTSSSTPSPTYSATPLPSSTAIFTQPSIATGTPGENPQPTFNIP